MRRLRDFVVTSMIGGLLVLVPLYLSALLLLKATATVMRLIRPFRALLPGWLPAETALSVVLVLLLCFLVGVVVRTSRGRLAQRRIERSLFERMPAYAVFRGLSQRLLGEAGGSEWTPALAELEGGLAPAFIVEEVVGGRFTVFIPSVPTPLAGAVYILPRERVHPLDVTFTQTLKVISGWGSGAKQLFASMERERGDG